MNDEWRPLLDLIDDTRTRNIIKNLPYDYFGDERITSIEVLSKMSSKQMVKYIVGCGKLSASIMWLALNKLNYSEPSDVEGNHLPRWLNSELIEWQGRRFKLVK